MSRLPDDVIEVFTEMTGDTTSVTPTMSESLELRREDDWETEVTRPIAKWCYEETGYVITGIRQHDWGIEVWLDDLRESDESPDIDRLSDDIAQSVYDELGQLCEKYGDTLNQMERDGLSDTRAYDSVEQEYAALATMRGWLSQHFDIER